MRSWRLGLIAAILLALCILTLTLYTGNGMNDIEFYNSLRPRQLNVSQNKIVYRFRSQPQNVKEVNQEENGSVLKSKLTHLPEVSFGKCNSTSQPKYLKILQKGFSEREINQLQASTICHQKNDIVLEYKYTSDGICKSTANKIKFVIFIYSVDIDFTIRSNLRKDFDSQIEQLSDALKNNYEVKYVFGIGFSDKATVDSATRLQQEYNEKRDIIQGYFHDFYENLPMKTLFMDNWFMKYCSNFNYLVKMDSDVKLYIGNMLNIQKSFPKHNHWMVGRIIHTSRPVMDPKSHFYAPRSVYNRDTYPPYLDGFANIYTPATVRLLFKTSFKVPVFYIDDVYFNGLVREVTNITLHEIGRFCRFGYHGDKCVAYHP